MSTQAPAYLPPLSDTDTHPVILFDGVCNLCDSFVSFLVDQDKQHLLRYASLQSAYGQRVLAAQSLDSAEFKSMIFLDNDRVYQQSDAALRILSKLGGIYALFGIFLIVPRFIRDTVYNWVASNRYRLWGKKDTCRLPKPEERALFYED